MDDDAPPETPTPEPNPEVRNTISGEADVEARAVFQAHTISITME
ncbi:hypothetical protein [Cryptosporangium aurantiacum]|uniref:Uncharacterized protein n=1 Tax=Cryptosporangium aurantiacum TaxID=134849 RepID=A0A1M7QFN3_9ACTN|nr:hypothetical protein [Cryptosporangium aurantiacum]SHN29834.1 hypothetical protein SAMN05443668_104616 [Cryptosporangium aurantiacum]